MRLLFVLLAWAAFIFSGVGLFLKVPRSYLYAGLVAGFVFFGAAHFWGLPLSTVGLSLVIGLIIASGTFVRTRM